jgi:ammonia channel protein AmtB
MITPPLVAAAERSFHGLKRGHEGFIKSKSTLNLISAKKCNALITFLRYFSTFKFIITFTAKQNTISTIKQLREKKCQLCRMMCIAAWPSRQGLL